MLRSNSSKSGSVDIGQRNHYSSVFSRTLSASKLRTGDDLVSQVDANALKFVGKKPSKVSNSSENRTNRGTMMLKQQIGEVEGELKSTKEKLRVSEFEKDQAKEEAHEANIRANDALSPKKTKELLMELENLKAMARDELKIKNKKIKSLEMELVRTRQFEALLVEKDASLNGLRKELQDVKEKEKGMMELLSENKRRIQELEAHVERAKESETNMVGSFAVQTKQLEETKIELEESKLEIMSLRDKIELLEALFKEGSSGVDNGNSREEIRALRFELQIAKEKIAQVEEAEKKASLKAKNLLDEMELIKNELKKAVDSEEKSNKAMDDLAMVLKAKNLLDEMVLKASLKAKNLLDEMELIKNELKKAVDSEEKSNKAMDDLAMVLKEVTAESNQAKEKLNETQIELEHVKAEAEQMKMMVRSTDERYQKLLDEAKKEAVLHKNTADRLRVEAEEAVLAWNGKEKEFVSCIKRVEEERDVACRENLKLIEALKAAEKMTKASKDETYRLRDIVKQAINESNAAQAAAGIAREENSVLKDRLAEMEEALHFIAIENERLRIDEAAAQENLEQLKRMLWIASTESKNQDEGTRNGMLSSPFPTNQKDGNNKTKRAFL